MKLNARTAALAILGVLFAGTISPVHGASSTSAGAADNWTSHNGDANETAYSQLQQITKDNIGHLGLAWSMDLPHEGSLEGTPVAVNGVLYVTGAWGKVFAVQGDNGKLLWTYDPEVWKHNPAKMRASFAVNRGVAYADGKIFLASFDGRLVALDAKTGVPIWTVQTVAADNLQYITGVPRVFNGKVIIGQGGADLLERGYVTAYDQATGKQVWRFYVVPGSPAQNQGDPAMEMAAKTWSADFWKTSGGGGGPWDSITFDSELNRIYIGTANASPYDPTVRSPGTGTNLFTASIVALDADTGKYIWHYQVVPRDEWDYDCTQQMILTELVIGGKRHKVLMQVPKDGFFYVIDRETGKLLSAGKIGKVTWASGIDLKTGLPVEEPHDRYDNGGVSVTWPAPMGAHSWMAMSYDSQTGLVYVPIMQLGLSEAKNVPQADGFQVGAVNVLGVVRYPGDNKGTLVAWDPVQQKSVWSVQHPYIWNGGVLSTAGGVVFQGTADGTFAAYDAKTGKLLWHVRAGGGVIGSPMTFAAGGKQYVAILVGYGGSIGVWGNIMNVGWKWGQPRHLLVFTLDGTAPLPPTPALDTSVHAVDDPSYKINPAEAAAGHSLYIACAACHGLNLISAGSPAPDLRASRIALNPAAFFAVVHNGALLQEGMPRFDNLTQDEVNDLYAYIRAGAREAIKEKP